VEVFPDTGTWSRTGSACMSWFLGWRAPGEALPAVLDTQLRAIPALLPGFAVATTPDWVARASGRTTAYLLTLDLVLTGPDGKREAVLPAGGQLGLTGWVAGERQHELTLEVALQVDVYARLTAGDRRNDDLADLNAPRIAAFLARLRVATGARFARTHAPGVYAAQVTAYGFHPTRRTGSVAPPDVVAALLRGQELRLTDRPADPEVYRLSESDVRARRMLPHGYEFRRRTVFLDGSTGVGSSVDLLDEDEARVRLARLFETGYHLVEDD
jgi:hypothetical protein